MAYFKYCIDCGEKFFPKTKSGKLCKPCWRFRKDLVLEKMRSMYKKKKSELTEPENKRETQLNDRDEVKN